MSTDEVLQLVTWGWCHGIADLLTKLRDEARITPLYASTLAEAIANEIDLSLRERGIDPVERLEVLEPLDHLIVKERT